MPRKKPKWWKSRIMVVMGLLFAAAIFIWLGRGIADNWETLSTHLTNASPWLLIGAVAAQLLFMLCVGLCYYNSLRLAGARVPATKAISVYLASQLGKYVPGKVLYVAGQIGLATWLRISTTESVLGFTAHHIQLVAMGMAASGPLLGMLMDPVLMIVMVTLAVLGVLILASGIWVGVFNKFQRKRRKPELKSFSPLRAIAALASAGLGWIAYGCIAVLFTTVLAPGLSSDASIQIGMAAVAAWLLGFLSFITPVGVGVREGTFVLLTRTIVPEPTAMAVALLMRLLLTAFQVPIGALALAFVIKGRPDRAANG
jgi:uncharacterized membrane protein YbhN (UPF0104 family)